MRSWIGRLVSLCLTWGVATQVFAQVTREKPIPHPRPFYIQADSTKPNVYISPASGTVTGTSVAVTIGYGDACELPSPPVIKLNGQDITSSFTYTGGGGGPQCTGVTGKATGTINLRAGVDTLWSSITNEDAHTGYDTVYYTGVTPVHALRVQVAAGAMHGAPNTKVSVAFTVTNIGNTIDTVYTKNHCYGYGLVPDCWTTPDSAFGLMPDSIYSGTAYVWTSDSVGQMGRLETIAYERSRAGVTDTAYTDITVQNPLGPGVVLSTVTPDVTRPRSKCLTIEIQPNVAYECGDLRVVHPLPTTSTYNKARSPALIYNSQSAIGVYAIGALVTFNSSMGTPDTVHASITDSATGSVIGTNTWLGSYWVNGATQRVTVRANELGNESQARWAYTFTAKAVYNSAHTTQSYSATSAMISVSEATSNYFEKVLAGQEYLVIPQWLGATPWNSTKPLFWSNSDGDTRQYNAVPGDSLVWAAAGVDRPDTIKSYNGPTLYGLYRYAEHGAVVHFDPHGPELEVIDRLGHHTRLVDTAIAGVAAATAVDVPSPNGGLPYVFMQSYGYRLDSVVVPSVSGQSRTVHFRYDTLNLYVDTLKDPDGSFEVYTFLNGQPHLPGYDLMTRYQDKHGTITRFYYDSAFKLTKAIVDSGGEIAIKPNVPALNITWTFQPSESQGYTIPVAPDSAYTRVAGPRANQYCTFPLQPCPDSADVTRFWVDQWGEPYRIRDAHGYEIELTRANATYPSLVTYARFQNGQVVTATYDARGNLATETDSSFTVGGLYPTTHYAYDQTYDFLTQLTAPLGEQWSAQYDPNSGNRLWQQPGTDASRRITFSYNPLNGSGGSGLMASDSTPLAPAPEKFTYDATLANLATTVTPLNEQTAFTRDAIGRIIRTASPVSAGDSVIDSVAFNAMSRDTLNMTFSVVHDRTQADTIIVRDSISLAGDLLGVKRRAKPDRNSIGWLVTNFVYDSIGRKITEIPPNATNALTPAENYGYDASGNQTYHLTRRGYAITTVFDALNRVVQRIIPQSNPETDTLSGMLGTTPFVWTFPRYPNSGAALVIPADTSTFVYDAAGHMIAANNGDAHISRTYYKNGLLLTDESDLRTWTNTDFTQHDYRDSIAYDLEGRRALLHAPANVAPTKRGTNGSFTNITYTYDPTYGVLSTVTDPLGNVFKYFYDAELRVDSVSSPGGIGEKRTYDGDERLATRIELGDTTLYYGILSGVHGRIHWDTFTYDQRGRIVADHMNDGMDSVVNGYALPDGLVSTVAGGSSTGTFTATAPIQLTGTWLADAIGTKVTGQVCQQSYACNASATPLQLFQYQANTGRLMADSTQITGVGNDFPTLDFYYNASGTPAYDSSGNQTRAYHYWWTTTYDFFDLGGQHNFYDAAERLRAVDVRAGHVWAGSGNLSCQPPYEVNNSQLTPYDEYRYDALGRRVMTRSRVDTVSAESVCGTGSTFQYSHSTIERDVWDGNQLLVEVHMAGSDTTSNLETDTATVADALPHYGRVMYVNSPLLDRPLDIIRTGYAYLSTFAGDTSFYPWLSAFAVVPHYSWRNMVDDGSFTDGTEVGDGGPEGISHGHCIHYQDNPSNGIWCVGITWADNSEGIYQNVWSGGEFGPPSWFGNIATDFHDNTGLVYRRNRFYDPNVGQFTQEDPAGLAGGLNAYGFANGDPVNYSDPFGLCPPADSDYRTCDNPLIQAAIQIGRQARATNQAVAGFAAVSVVGGIGGAVLLGEAAEDAAAPAAEEAASSTTEAAESLEPSEGQIQQFTRQLEQNGRSSVEKSIRSLSRRIDEHLEKLADIRAKGGNAGSVERELANFRQQIEAAQRVLGSPQQ